MSQPSQAEVAPQAEVVLSAERVEVTTRRVPTERVHLRREVVTEEMTVVVTVRREVLTVEREPFDGQHPGDVAGTPFPGPADRPAAPFDVVLSAERPVVSLEVVPYERVRVSTRVVPTTTRAGVSAAHEVAAVVRSGTA